MNENEDVKDQLKIKNKEIYLNKLNLDLDNNLEVLVLTVDNLLNTNKEMLIKKIIDIEESFLNQELIEEKVSSFFEQYRVEFMNLLDNKKLDLKNTIIIHDDLEICKNNIQDNYFSLEKQIKEFTCQEIKQLEKLLLNDINDKFKQKRLKDYLENIFIINLNNKILDIIRNRDIILINTFQETYLKYLELNKNTIGV